MLEYPIIDPVIVALGPLKIRWYGMMYLLGFLAAYWLGRRRARLAWSPLQPEQVEDLIFYGALGAVLGGRVGYVLFYGFDQFLGDPLWLFRVWEGGMAFHGGLLGVFVALILYARKIGKPIGEVADFVAPLAPIGLGLGRLANFINAELYGRVTDVPWAMVFPDDTEPRHPSQLYQATLEGAVLLLILLFFARKARPKWSVTGLFLVGYGLARYGVEFFREPDASLAFDWMTRGQLLSLPMIIGGIGMIIFSYAYANSNEAVSSNSDLQERDSSESKRKKKVTKNTAKNTSKKSKAKKKKR